MEKTASAAITGIKVAYLAGSNKNISSWNETADTVTPTFETETTWEALVFTLTTAAYDELHEKTPQGSRYSQTLTFTVPGDSTELFALWEKLEHVPLAVAFEYEEGTVKVIGSPTYPAFVSRQFIAAQPGNKGVLKFFSISPRPAKFLAAE